VNRSGFSKDTGLGAALPGELCNTWPGSPSSPDWALNKGKQDAERISEARQVVASIAIVLRRIAGSFIEFLLYRLWLAAVTFIAYATPRQRRRRSYPLPTYGAATLE
jgi:hypothetical protein